MPHWLPYESWLNPGDNAWQMTAATLVGLMSIPGLAVLYGGVMQKRWSVNSMMLTFIAFAVVLVAWVLWAFRMGFGSPVHLFGAGSGSFFANMVGNPSSVLGHLGLTVTRLIRVSFGPFQLGELAEGAVEEVRTRVLREQLGERVAALSGADFSAPIVPPPTPQQQEKPRREERQRSARPAAAREPARRERPQNRKPGKHKSLSHSWRAQ